MTKRFLNLELKSDVALDESGILVGYGSVYGNVDNAGDIIAPGAFAKSIKDKQNAKKKVPFLYQHEWNQPIGVIEEMKEDATGLLIKVKLNLETQLGREAYSLIKQGAITGLSVGFQTVKDEVDVNGIRTIKEARLWEVSAVTFPCNEQAQIASIKSQYIKFGGEKMKINQKKINDVILKVKGLKADAEDETLNKNDFDSVLTEVLSLLQPLADSAKNELVLEEPKTDVGAEVEDEPKSDEVAEDSESKEDSQVGDEPAEDEKTDEETDAEVKEEDEELTELSDDEAAALEEVAKSLLHSINLLTK